MNYKILEARIEYAGDKLKRVTVLVDCTSYGNNPYTKSYSDVRAIYATNKPCSGYHFLMPKDKVSEDLLQKVAAAGMESMDRDEIFPNWRNKLKEVAA